MRAATRETFLEYVDHWYTGPKMVVGIAGNFDEGIRQEVEEMLGGVESGDPGRAAPAPDSNGAEPSVQIHSKESDQAHIAMGVPSYPLSHPDRYALQLLGTVLGTGMSSRLFTEVRERRGLAYYVFATNHSYTDTGTLYSQAGVDIKRIDEAIETIARELKKIAAEPVPADSSRSRRTSPRGASCWRRRARTG